MLIQIYKWKLYFTKLYNGINFESNIILTIDQIFRYLYKKKSIHCRYLIQKKLFNIINYIRTVLIKNTNIYDFIGK